VALRDEGGDATGPWNPGDQPIAVAAGHFNGDGRDDFAVANVMTNRVAVLAGRTPGRSPARAYPLVAGDRPVALTVADFNRDGRPTWRSPTRG
jgi:hypothetical protein